MFNALRHSRICRVPRRVLLLACVIAGASLPVTYAAASSVNGGADHQALGAYRGYLNSLLGSEGAAQSGERAVVSNVRSGCGGALSNLRHARSNSRVRAAMNNFGHEIDADLTLAAVRQRRGAVNALAGSLGRLHWSSARERAVTRNLISAQRGLMHVASSNLCLDAFSLSGSPSSTPGGTSGFLRSYDRAHGRLQGAESAFGSLLTGYAGSSRGLLGQDRALAARYSGTSQAHVNSTAGSVLSALGI